MKRFLIVALLTATNTMAQWTYKTVDNGFDEPFKKALNVNRDGDIILLEEGEYDIMTNTKPPLLAIKGTYFCEDNLFVELSFHINGSRKLYAFDVMTSSDKKYIYFPEYIWDAEFITVFKAASKLLVRVNQSYCSDDYFEFNFSGSTNAYNFIVK